MMKNCAKVTENIINKPIATTSKPFTPIPTQYFGHSSMNISSECKQRTSKFVVNQTAFSLNCGEKLNGVIIPATVFCRSKVFMAKKMPEIKMLIGTKAKVSFNVRTAHSKMEISRECQLRSFSLFCIFWWSGVMLLAG